MGISFNNDETKEIIREVYSKYNYLMCPHTAIGYGGLKRFLKKGETGVFLSTAHPVKFKDIVDPLISEEVEIPLRLQKIINRKKNAIFMRNRYEDFKQYLLA
jgi:threonine synthase